ncbi:MAG: tetratricopeptide repeat protein [Deltaproteobacteria bacterium]|nr:tetratricopeptide repeat protein [Deltaproteobacteria bacterium]
MARKKKPLHNNVGLSYLRLGKWDEAIAAYKRAVALRPDFAEHYYDLALSESEKNL